MPLNIMRQMYILQFDPDIEVLQTKAKPKKIIILTVCGKSLKYLVKQVIQCVILYFILHTLIQVIIMYYVLQEINGDLRKDARMMDFNCTINRCCDCYDYIKFVCNLCLCASLLALYRLMQEDAEGRKRKLRLRTYSVVQYYSTHCTLHIAHYMACYDICSH